MMMMMVTMVLLARVLVSVQGSDQQSSDPTNSNRSINTTSTTEQVSSTKHQQTLNGSGEGRCPDNWTAFNDSCYKAFNSGETWGNALEICKNLLSSLVHIGSAGEENFTVSLVANSSKSRSSFWIGLSDSDKEEEFRWSWNNKYLTRNKSQMYHNWFCGEPNGKSNENCVQQILRNAHSNCSQPWGWNDISCKERLHFVCERKDCQCNLLGSVDNNCSVDTGKCRCRRGVTGLKCDRCKSGYFNLTHQGCTKCSQFDKKVIRCNEDPGPCLCGDKATCTGNQYRTADGQCVACSCDHAESKSQKCNDTADCPCKHHTGTKCNCHASPGCHLCACNHHGSTNIPAVAGKCPCRQGEPGDDCSSCSRSDRAKNRTSNTAGKWSFMKKIKHWLLATHPSKKNIEEAGKLLKMAIAYKKKRGSEQDEATGEEHDFEEISNGIFAVVQKVLLAQPDEVRAAQVQENTSSTIVQAVEMVGLYSPRHNISNKQFAARTKSTEDFSQTIVDVIVSSLTTPSKITYNVHSIVPRLNACEHNVSRLNSNPPGHYPLVSLSERFLQNCSNCTNREVKDCMLRLQFNVFSKGILFQDFQHENFSKGTQTMPDSWVVGVQLNDLEWVSSTQSIVELALQPFTKDKRHHCVFWNFTKNNKLGGWSTDGCVTRMEGEQTLCMCNHLTNFALLLSEDVDTSKSLAVASTIVLSLSSVGLFATVIAHLLVSHLRRNTQSRIIVGLSANLLFLNLVVVTGAERTNQTALCKFVAMAMHYFLLSSFGWMMVEAVHLYLKIIRVFNSNVLHFMKKSVLLAQGVPAIIVALTSGLAFDSYADASFCRLSVGVAFYVSVVLPLTVTMILIYLIFGLVQHTLKQRNTAKQASEARMNRLRTSLSLSTLTGLTWLFGILLLIHSTAVLQWLFILLVATQGVFIFYYQFATHRSLQSAWKELSLTSQTTTRTYLTSDGDNLTPENSTDV